MHWNDSEFRNASNSLLGHKDTALEKMYISGMEQMTCLRSQCVLGAGVSSSAHWQAQSPPVCFSEPKESKQREGVSASRVSVVFFVLHWKRGSVGTVTLKRAGVVVSTAAGRTGWPWYVRFKSVLTQPEQLLERVSPHLRQDHCWACLWFGWSPPLRGRDTSCSFATLSVYCRPIWLLTGTISENRTSAVLSSGRSGPGCWQCQRSIQKCFHCSVP